MPGVLAAGGLQRASWPRCPLAWGASAWNSRPRARLRPLSLRAGEHHRYSGLARDFGTSFVHSGCAGSKNIQDVLHIDGTNLDGFLAGVFFANVSMFEAWAE